MEALNPDSETSLLRSKEFLGSRLAEDDFLVLLESGFWGLNGGMTTFWGVRKANFTS